MCYLLVYMDIRDFMSKADRKSLDVGQLCHHSGVGCVSYDLRAQRDVSTNWLGINQMLL